MILVENPIPTVIARSLYQIDSANRTPVAIVAIERDDKRRKIIDFRSKSLEPDAGLRGDSIRSVAAM
ncbi:MAG: hypothetical protein PHP75_01940 [Methylacidiphilaceae bacterium]|nr:hypothetical protein [Candidatus Methylacidiphilaceae bacterium]